MSHQCFLRRIGRPISGLLRVFFSCSFWRLSFSFKRTLLSPGWRVYEVPFHIWHFARVFVVPFCAILGHLVIQPVLKPTLPFLYVLLVVLYEASRHTPYLYVYFFIIYNCILYQSCWITLVSLGFAIFQL